MKAKINPEVCTGCGLCADTCPKVFAMHGDVAVVVAEHVPEADMPACREAAGNCPVEAITIED